MSDEGRESADDIVTSADSGVSVEPAPAASPRSWYRRRRTWLLSAAAVLVGFVVAGTLVLIDTDGGLAVGTLLPAAGDEIQGTEVRFELPTGRVSFTVADPVEAVAEDSRVRRRGRRAEARRCSGSIGE